MPDIRSNTNTTASMGTEATFYGELETGTDRDWIRVEMDRGDALQVNLDGDYFYGTPVDDTYLTIYDRDGNEVASNDDFGGLYSQTTFTATYNGSYYIEAAAYTGVFAPGGFTGDYVITTQEIAAPPAADPLDSIAWGTSLDTSDPINVYFATDGQEFDGYTSEGFNNYERGQIIEMLEQLEDITDLEFNIVFSAAEADLTLVLDLDEISNEANPYLGYFNPPGTFNEGVGVFNGDLWDRSAGGDLDRGGFGYVTVVHELLHGLGMAHPHDTGGSSSVMEGVSSNFNDYGSNNLNQGIFTVMTYNSGYFTGTDGSAPENPSAGDYGFEGGAMALDIAYLQQLYGANSTHAGGDQLYVLATENQAGTYWEAIWDTGGTDEIRHNGSDNATIDLRAATLEYEFGGGGFVSAVDGVQGGFTIANGVMIENARGGNGNDTLIGNEGGNKLIGGRGNDDISGNEGVDKIKGGAGNDDLNGGDGGDTIKGGSGGDTINGDNGGDKIKGGGGADIINGGNGNDKIKGGTKDDVLDGGAGRDVLTGGGGADTFVFSALSDSSGSTVDTITDFKRGVDTIDLSELDAVSSQSGDQDFAFVGTGGFTGAGQVRIDRDSNGVTVQADVDGDGVADFEIIVDDVNNLTASDFIL